METNNVLMGDWRSEINTGKSGASATETTDSGASKIIDTEEVETMDANIEESGEDAETSISTPVLIGAGVLLYFLFKKFMK